MRGRVKRTALVDAGRSFPIENVNEFPRVLIQIPLQFALFVEHELRQGMQNANALGLVLVVNFDDSGGKIVRYRLAIGPGLRKTDLAVGHKDNFPSGWRRNHPDVGTVIAECASYLDVADRSHPLKCIDQSLVLSLLVGLNQICLSAGVENS
jgi:hypothetical protein